MRYTLYGKINVGNDQYLDPMTCDFSKFEWTNGYYRHTITKNEILKPYLISSAYYGTVVYEELILLINNIVDIFAVVAGKELKIPKLDDLKKFILDNTK